MFEHRAPSARQRDRLWSSRSLSGLVDVQIVTRPLDCRTSCSSRCTFMLSSITTDIETNLRTQSIYTQLNSDFFVLASKKGSPYSITERRVPELIPAVGCHYFPPGLHLPSQPLRGLLPISLFSEQRHDGCEQFA